MFSYSGLYHTSPPLLVFLYCNWKRISGHFRGCTGSAVEVCCLYGLVWEDDVEWLCNFYLVCLQAPCLHELLNIYVQIFLFFLHIMRQSLDYFVIIPFKFHQKCVVMSFLTICARLTDESGVSLPTESGSGQERLSQYALPSTQLWVLQMWVWLIVLLFRLDAGLLCLCRVTVVTYRCQHNPMVSIHKTVIYSILRYSSFHL